MLDSITLRGKCPICGRGPLRPLQIDYRVFVAKPDGTDRVGGLLAYQCTQGLHLFFVMAHDLEELREVNSA
jgi:hypothetical protein